MILQITECAHGWFKVEYSSSEKAMKISSGMGSIGGEVAEAKGAW